jgi:hypothetical protein
MVDYDILMLFKCEYIQGKIVLIGTIYLERERERYSSSSTNAVIIIIATNT